MCEFKIPGILIPQGSEIGNTFTFKVIIVDEGKYSRFLEKNAPVLIIQSKGITKTSTYPYLCNYLKSKYHPSYSYQTSLLRRPLIWKHRQYSHREKKMKTREKECPIKGKNIGKYSLPLSISYPLKTGRKSNVHVCFVDVNTKT